MRAKAGNPMADTFSTTFFKPQTIGRWIEQYLYNKKALLHPEIVQNISNEVDWSRGGNTVTFPVFGGGSVAAQTLDITGATTTEAAAISTTSETATVVNKIIPIVMSDVQFRDMYDAKGFFNKLMARLGKEVGQTLDMALIAAAESGALAYDGSAATITYNGTVGAKLLWQDYQDSDAYLITHYKPYSDLAKLSEVKTDTFYAPIAGRIPVFYGMPVLQSKNITVIDDTTDTYNNLIVQAGSLVYGFRQEITYNPVKLPDYRTRHEFVFSYFVKKIKSDVEPVIIFETQ
jgi:hypothetical protein